MDGYLNVSLKLWARSLSSSLDEYLSQVFFFLHRKNKLARQGCRQTEAIAQASGIGNTICVLFVYSSSLFAGCVNNVGLEGPNAWKL